MGKIGPPPAERWLLAAASDEIALPLLARLRQRSPVPVVILTQPDRARGRGKVLSPNPVKAWALEHGLGVWQPRNPGIPDELGERVRPPEMAVVMAYGRIFRQKMLDWAVRGTWNWHGSVLPKLRGASPVETALAEGFERTGVSLMRMVARMDAGPVGAVLECGVEGDDTRLTLRRKIGEAAAGLLEAHWPDLWEGRLTLREQNEAAATYSRLIVKEDGWLDFRLPATDLERRIRAFNPWPGASFGWRGERIKVGTAEVCTGSSGGVPGEVEPGDGPGLRVATGRGCLSLRQLQRPGSRMLGAAEFLRGFPIEPGSVLGSHPSFPLVSDRPFSYPRH